MVKRKRTQEAIGIRTVKQYIMEIWESIWHDVDQINDDGVDGIIQLRRKNRDTGGIIFVQVKCGEGYKVITKKRPDYIGVNLGKKYIDSHRPAWKILPGPAILIYVDPSASKSNPTSWWTDLKSNESYSQDNSNIILIPKKQKFGAHSKGEFIKMCGTGPTDRQLPIVVLERNELDHINFTESLKAQAGRIYREWAKSPSVERHNPSLGDINVSRSGWRHICRKGRKPERIIQSLLLLSAAKKIIKEVGTWDRLGHAVTQKNQDNSIVVMDYIGIRARVCFPHRHESVIQVVLRRKRRIDPAKNIIDEKIWFFSIYELRRKRSIEVAKAY